MPTGREIAAAAFSKGRKLSLPPIDTRNVVASIASPPPRSFESPFRRISEPPTSFLDMFGPTNLAPETKAVMGIGKSALGSEPLGKGVLKIAALLQSSKEAHDAFYDPGRGGVAKMHATMSVVSDGIDLGCAVAPPLKDIGIVRIASDFLAIADLGCKLYEAATQPVERPWWKP